MPLTIYKYNTIYECSKFAKQYYSNDLFNRLNNIVEDMSNDNKRVSILSKKISTGLGLP